MHGPGTNGARRRGMFALATAVGALVALAIMAGASWSATGSSSASQYQYGHKVTICHHTHSKKHPQVTITVDQHAVKAHLKHGDTLGACTSTTTSTSSTSSGSSSSGGSDNHHGKSNGNSQGHGNSGSNGKGHSH